jgi:hypothetical protein
MLIQNKIHVINALKKKVFNYGMQRRRIPRRHRLVQIAYYGISNLFQNLVTTDLIGEENVMRISMNNNKQLHFAYETFKAIQQDTQIDVVKVGLPQETKIGRESRGFLVFIKFSQGSMIDLAIPYLHPARYKMLNLHAKRYNPVTVQKSPTSN